jgi:hypothetical protein
MVREVFMPKARIQRISRGNSRLRIVKPVTARSALRLSVTSRWFMGEPTRKEPVL